MRRLTGLIVAASLAAGGLGVGAYAIASQPAPATVQAVYRDLAGSVVVPEEPIDDSTGTHQVGTQRLQVPSVGLDVPLGAMDAGGRVVNPPGFQSAYLVRDLGGEGGTSFVAMHSLRGGGVGPGNALFAPAANEITVAPGHEIMVGGVLYRVTDTEVIPKAALPTRADVWQDIPGRLVLLTCAQNVAGTPSTANVVITAQRA